MRNTFLNPLFIWFSFLNFLLASESSNDWFGKKFIHLGWDIPNTEYLRLHWQEMEEKSPFDGVMFYIVGKPDGKRRVDSQSAWDTNKWKIDWFTNAIQDLGQCQFKKFTDNFIRFNATPGNIDWENDEGWNILFEKARICARISKAVGAKGLAIDFESYGKPQFKYDYNSRLSFEQTKSLARKRGQGFVQAITREQPDAILLALWLNSINFRAANSDNPDSVLIGEEYGLLPAFIDGMLDSIPPSMTLVDGCELGYYMDSSEEFLQAAHNIRSWTGAAMRLVSLENRKKYLAQMQVGFGIYLDMYLNEAGNRNYFPPLDGSRLKRLYRNLTAAANAADKYVWIYGEQCRWWQTATSDKWFENLSKTVGKGRLWDEALPGIARLITFVNKPEQFVEQELKSKTLTNIAVNPDFSIISNNGNLTGFSVWQDEKLPKGVFLPDKNIGNGSALAKKVLRGCLIQKHNVIAGEFYYLRVKSLSKGNSAPSLMARWQTTDGKWCCENKDKIFTFKKTDSQWQVAQGWVQVPERAGYLVILLNVSGQIKDQDQCWFDDLEVYKLPPLF
ncbi:MAG: hypothetical protein ACPMAG_03480 [Limisphaerales bacterium]|jgi:hypothetical protein